MILVLRKARSWRAPNLGCSRAELPGWFFVSSQNSAQDVMHEQACCHDEAANHHLPIIVAFWIIQIVSMEECSSLTQNLMQICCSTHSVILNAMATQYTCSLNGVYRPYWLGQWSCHCLCIVCALFVHSSPLSLGARLHRCHANHSHCTNNGWPIVDREAKLNVVSLS